MQTCISSSGGRGTGSGNATPTTPAPDDRWQQFIQQATGQVSTEDAKPASSEVDQEIQQLRSKRWEWYPGGHHFALIDPEGVTRLRVPRFTSKDTTQPAAPTDEERAFLLDQLNAAWTLSVDMIEAAAQAGMVGVTKGARA